MPTLLALEYDLFSFAGQLTLPQRRITLAEAIFLTILLFFCIVAFVIRRLREERSDVARHAAMRMQLRGLRTLASQDHLTALPNRRALLTGLIAATTSPPSDGRKHAFFLIDLNGFKRVNDLRGHAIGDRVLHLSYNVDRDTARAIGRRFIRSLEGEIRVGGHSHKIGASIGIALIRDHGTTAEEIMHHADLTMYRAKGEDQSSFVFFEPASTHPRSIRR